MQAYIVPPTIRFTRQPTTGEPGRTWDHAVSRPSKLKQAATVLRRAWIYNRPLPVDVRWAHFGCPASADRRSRLSQEGRRARGSYCRRSRQVHGSSRQTTFCQPLNRVLESSQGQPKIAALAAPSCSTWNTVRAALLAHIPRGRVSRAQTDMNPGALPLTAQPRATVRHQWREGSPAAQAVWLSRWARPQRNLRSLSSTCLFRVERVQRSPAALGSRTSPGPELLEPLRKPQTEQRRRRPPSSARQSSHSAVGCNRRLLTRLTADLVGLSRTTRCPWSPGRSLTHRPSARYYIRSLDWLARYSDTP